MAGLLERARVIVQKKGGGPPISAARDGHESDDSGISSDERRELLEQIDRLFRETRPIETRPRQKMRGGAAFPLYVNVIAVVILAGAILAVGQLTNRGLGQTESGSGNFLTTEGLVVQRVKQQAAAELGASQTRIAEIKRELENLRSSAGSGAGGAVSAASTERQQQLEAELAKLQSSTTDKLASLAAQQQQQAFLIRQLRAIYQNIGSDVSGGNVSGALAGVASADQLLNEKVSSGGEIASIAPALAAGNAVLRAALLYGQSAESALQAASKSDLSAKMAAVEQLVQQGDARYSAGNLTDAHEYYTKAIDTLDSVSRAYARLNEMATASNQEQIKQLVAQIDRLKGDVAGLQATISQQQATIAEQRTQIGSDKALIAKQQGEIGSQKTLIAEQERKLAEARVAVQKRTEELSTVVQAMQRSVAPDSGSASQLDPSETVNLLKTKVEIRSLVETPEARKAYPLLSSQIDAFFKKYADIFARQGREAALNQVASALNDVIVSLNLKLQENSTSPLASPTGMLEQQSAGSVSRADPISSYLGEIDGTLQGLLYRSN